MTLKSKCVYLSIDNNFKVYLENLRLPRHDIKFQKSKRDKKKKELRTKVEAQLRFVLFFSFLLNFQTLFLTTLWQLFAL